MAAKIGCGIQWAIKRCYRHHRSQEPVTRLDQFTKRLANPPDRDGNAAARLPVGSKTIGWMLGAFADALRVDGQGWKALKPEEPLIKELRLLCRNEVSLIEQRTAFIQQLRHAVGILSCGFRGL
jgi:hypothetical protein